MHRFIVTEPGEDPFRFETIEKAAVFLWSELCGENVTVLELGEGPDCTNVTSHAVEVAKLDWAAYHGNDRDYGDYPEEPGCFSLTRCDAKDLLRDAWREAADYADYVREVSSVELSGRY